MAPPDPGRTWTISELARAYDVTLGPSDAIQISRVFGSANLLSLQTRQELGTISLSIAQRSEQSILRLF